MDKNQLIQICKYVGIDILFDHQILKENRSLYENYAQLEFNNGAYEYAEINFERQPNPDKENIITFTNEAKATKYFLIKLLKKFYFPTIFPANNPVHDFKNVNELTDYFQKLGVPISYSSFNTIQPQTICYEVDSSNKMVISYINSSNQKSFTTIPLSSERGLFVMYRLTYSLTVLKELEIKLIKQNLLDENFEDEDIELFIK